MVEQWGEEDDSSAPPTPPVVGTIVRRKFEDEENDTSDVLDSWDAEDESEVEREKAAAAAERKLKADAQAIANKKSKTQRIAEKEAEKARLLAEENDEVDEEDLATRRKRLFNTQIESDMVHVEDLFSGSSNNQRKVTTAANAVQIATNDPTAILDLTTLPLFDPKTKLQFEKLRDTLIPVISQNSNKAHYTIFLQEFTKQLAKDLPSDQVKKIASSLTALSNEKLKEEKLAERGGKKSKAAKSKVTLVASKNMSGTPDVQVYDDDYGDDDFM